MAKNLDTLRGLVRPIITLAFTALVLLMFWTGKQIPDLLRVTWLAILGEWFGERLLFKALSVSGKNTE